MFPTVPGGEKQLLPEQRHRVPDHERRAVGHQRLGGRQSTGWNEAAEGAPAQ